MKEYRQDDQVYYACGVCGLAFAEKTTAEECEAWCAQGKG